MKISRDIMKEKDKKKNYKKKRLSNMITDGKKRSYKITNDDEIREERLM